MKKITTFIFLLIVSIGYAQNLPMDFESGVTTSNFVDFDGGVATVIANPQSNADNNSATVAQIVRNGGEVWAGSKILLSTNLDFSTNKVISMKVFTTAPVGTIVKFKLEDAAGASVERNATTMTSGAWETLNWDFTGTPNTFNYLVFMFDFGNTGDGTATSTFLFDDVEQVAGGTQLTLPINFEGDVVTADFEDFNGGIATVIANPQSNTDNNSATVAQIVRNGGDIWAGSKLILPNNLDFSVNTTLSMKVYTTAPVGTVVKFKLEGTGAPVEKDVTTTVSGAWETLTWDFSGTPNDLNYLVFMFDFGNVGNGTATSTFLFDDITQGAGGTSGGGVQIDLPVTFQDTAVNYTMTDFGGNTSELVVDPTNTSNMAMKVIKSGSAELWAGTTISTPAGLASNIPLTLTDSKMTVRVWSPDAGIPVRLKVENANDNTQTCETEATTTVAGGWEALEFDFTNEVSGTAALATGINNGWIYSMASIFFNFGTDGATAGEKTYYFDDVMFGGLSVGTNNLNEIEGLSLFPNPTNTQWTILSEKSDIITVEIFDLQGKRLLFIAPNTRNVTINALDFANGLYFSKVSTATGTSTLKLIKQ